MKCFRCNSWPCNCEDGQTIIHGDCREVLRELPAVDTVLSDPPYGLSFMGREWDYGVPGKPFWEAVLRAAKPGAMLLAFGGTRTFHRLATAIEDAGWEIRDCLSWLYGTGFPKSLDISKAIDRARGAERPVVSTTASGGYKRIVAHNAEDGFRPADYYPEGNKFTSSEPITDLAKTWQGWGTALKPAWEPIILAMKPTTGTFAANAEQHGVAGLNIDAARIAHSEECRMMQPSQANIAAPSDKCRQADRRSAVLELKPDGRWPANVLFDEDAAAILDAQSGTVSGGDSRGKCSGKRAGGFANVGSESGDGKPCGQTYADKGGPSRFFYCAKASSKERGEGNDHPTVKPVELMRYLANLTKTPTGGTVLDPFMGSGTTLVAARDQGRKAIGIELEERYCEVAANRLRQGVLV